MYKKHYYNRNTQIHNIITYVYIIGMKQGLRRP